MTGLENQREFAVGQFSISEQSLRHVLAIVALVAVTLLSTEFFSVYFLYAIVGFFVVTMVIAFLVDARHEKLSMDE